MLKSHMSKTQQHVFRHDTRKLCIEHRRNQCDGNVISLKDFGAFGGCRDRAFMTAANTFTAADALFHNTGGLFVFNADGPGGANPQTRSVAGTEVLVKTDKTG